MSHDEGEEEQRRLSIRWETKHHWPELRKEFGVSKTGAAMILSLVTADGHRLRYSRNKEFYALPRRYRNPLFTYRRVTGAADYLAAQGLIYHSKSEPGQRGWQSSMMATPELVTRITQIIETGPPLVLAKPPEVIILRGADRMAIDYAETRFTRKVRRIARITSASIATTAGDRAMTYIAVRARIRVRTRSRVRTRVSTSRPGSPPRAESDGDC